MKLKELRKAGVIESKSVHAFYPTRWTVRGDTLAAVANNHNKLMELWEWSLAKLQDTEMKARVHGAVASMKTFQFLFGCLFGTQILRQTDNLSRTLQNPSLAAVAGQEIIKNVVELLEEKRNDATFDHFWDNLIELHQHYEVDEPSLPRKRKLPARYATGQEPYQHESPKSMYQKHYFEAYDNTIRNIKNRFDQPDFRVYTALQSVLLKAASKESFESDFDLIQSLYFEDFDLFSLKSQLELLPKLFDKEGVQNYCVCN